jgi:hypothetical protein
LVAIRRERRALPGEDAVSVWMVFSFLFLGMSVLSFVLAVRTQNQPDMQNGHLPWPLAEWAFFTPLGELVVTFVGGLLIGLPLGWAAPRYQIGLNRPVDTSENAAHALARFTGPAGQPMAQRLPRIVPFFMPLFLVTIAHIQAGNWLPTQWIFR